MSGRHGDEDRQAAAGMAGGIILLGIVVVLAASASATTLNTSVPSLDAYQSSTATAGVLLTALKNVTIRQVWKDTSNNTATNAILYSYLAGAPSSALKNVTFSGLSADLDYNLTAGTRYYVLFRNADGSYYSQRYKNGGLSFPYTSEHIAINSSRYDASDYTTYSFNVQAITTENATGGGGGGASPSYTLGLLSPATNDHSANGTVTFGYSLTMTDFGGNASNCSLYANHTGTPYVLTSTASILTNGTKYFTYASLNETTYPWFVNCSSLGAGVSAATTSWNITIDRTNPIASDGGGDQTPSTNGTTWSIHTSGPTMLYNRTFTDTYMYAVNSTLTYCSNATRLWNATREALTSSVENVTALLNVTQYLSGARSVCLNMSEEYSDDHTAKTIGQYSVTVSIPARTIEVTTDSGAYLKLYGQSASCNPDDISYAKEEDRYTWSLHFPCVRAEYNLTFNLSSSGRLDYRGSLYPFPAFVVGRHWIDFDAENATGYSVEPNENGGWRVTIKTSSPTMKFRSIGGLNIVHSSMWWNVTQEPVGVNDLEATGTTTESTTLAYTVPATYFNLTTNTADVSTSSSSPVQANSLVFSPARRVQHVTLSLYNDVGGTAYASVNFTYADGTGAASAEQSTTSLSSVGLTFYNPYPHLPVRNTTTMLRHQSTGVAHATSERAYEASVIGTTLRNETGAVLLNTSNGSVSLNVTGLATATTYVFYVDTWYNSSSSFVYNTTNTTGENRISVTTAVTGAIQIYIYDQDTGLLVTQNITVVVATNDSSETFYVTSGSVNVTDVHAGIYTVTLSGANYTSTNYDVTLSSDNDTETLNAYLSPIGSATVIFTTLDATTSSTIEGASYYMYRIVNGTLSLVSSKTSDITGRVQFPYTVDVSYTLIVNVTGYVSKTFTLDPIIYDSYNVKLTRSTTLPFEQDMTGVLLSYEPKLFSEGDNSINISFKSPGGRFTSYNYTLTYPGGSASDTGSTPTGEVFIVPFVIAGASVTSLVHINMTYTTAIGGTKRYSYSAHIINSPGNTTIIANKDNTYGLGLIERLMIGTFVILIVAGLITLAGGSVIGLVTGLLLMVFWIKIGFWPWYAGVISVIVGLAILMRRT